MGSGMALTHGGAIMARIVGIGSKSNKNAT